MNALLDALRAVAGRLLVWALNTYKLADIPSSDDLLADNTATIAQTIQSYMDAVDSKIGRAHV